MVHGDASTAEVQNAAATTKEVMKQMWKNDFEILNF
jgi:hypothetical protein